LSASTDDDRARTAARLIWQHWTAGTTIATLPEDCRPATRAAGYAVQAALQGAARESLFGWKVAATSTAGQQHIRVSGPMAGRLYAGRVVPAGGEVPSAGNRMRVAEPEFAFRMRRTLAPRGSAYSVDEVLDAVDALHPAIEIPDSRFEPFVAAGEPQLIADDACAWRFMLGAATTADWRALDLARHAVHGTVKRADGTRSSRDGSGAAVLGDPRIALAWLANELRMLGIPLDAGLVVSTGTCMQPLELVPGDAVVFDFGVLGTIGMRFAA
jgi:2-keto-4-pentenoate hydratase